MLLTHISLFCLFFDTRLHCNEHRGYRAAYLCFEYLSFLCCIFPKHSLILIHFQQLVWLSKISVFRSELFHAAAFWTHLRGYYIQWVLWQTSFYSFTKMHEQHSLHLCVSRDKLKSDTVTQSKKTQERIQYNKILNRESFKRWLLEQQFWTISIPRSDYQNCSYPRNWLNRQESIFYQKMDQKNINWKRSKLFQSTFPLQTDFLTNQIQEHFHSHSLSQIISFKFCVTDLSNFHFRSIGIVSEDVWYLQKKINKWEINTFL